MFMLMDKIELVLQGQERLHLTWEEGVGRRLRGMTLWLEAGWGQPVPVIGRTDAGGG